MYIHSALNAFLFLSFSSKMYALECIHLPLHDWHLRISVLFAPYTARSYSDISQPCMAREGDLDADVF
jgi:hypothetical protein